MAVCYWQITFLAQIWEESFETRAHKITGKYIKSFFPFPHLALLNTLGQSDFIQKCLCILEHREEKLLFRNIRHIKILSAFKTC